MNLIGEYPVSIDNKGRLRMPTALLRQLGDKPDDGKGVEFVVNKGIEKCLTLYPKPVWDAIALKMNKLNKFNEKNRLFVRRFYAGAYPVETDSADRILLQKSLLDYAELTDEAVLSAMDDRIEIWSPALYEASLAEATPIYSDLSDVVMGGGKAGVGQIDNEESDIVIP
ncbi:MAG: division/cell wall cluster transcriptional repressor MraZ [Saprospiraceae bacterium]